MSSREAGKVTALLVDEAHLLAPAMLEELRMLTSFEMDAAPVFTLDGAMRQVFQHSHGTPRSIDRLVLRMLELAYCHQQQLVDEETVELALAE